MVNDMKIKTILIIMLTILVLLGIHTIIKANSIETIEMEVVNVSQTTDGKSFDFEDGTGYYIETTDGNLWTLTEEIEVGNTVVFDTMGTESVYDDVIIDIK
jgi:hypothetical protein